MKIPNSILSKVRDILKKVKSTFEFLSSAKTLDTELTIYKVYPSGEKEEVFKNSNLIVLASKYYILSSIYKSTFVLNTINRLQVGTGGTVDPAGLYPKTPNSSLSTLYTPTIAVNTSYVENVTIPSVTFIADIDQTLANGTLINEACLLFTNGAMFNIKTFPGIPKTADFSIHFEWTIRIA